MSPSARVGTALAAPSLHEAVSSDNLTLVRALIERYATENLAKVHPSSGLDTMLVAAGVGSGAENPTVPQLEVRNSRGRTPLQVACAQQNHDIVVALLDAGANANAKDRRGCAFSASDWNLSHHEWRTHVFVCVFSRSMA